MNRTIVRLVTAFLPSGLVDTLRRHRQRRIRDAAYARVGGLDQPVVAAGFDYEAAVRFLVGKGIPEEHVRGGSIPESSLRYCGRFLEIAAVGKAAPVLGLHVGNFIGVSLAYFVNAVRNLHPGSCVFSIDPGIPHRTVVRPIPVSLDLLGHFGLLRNVSISVGYSLEKSIGNDGTVFEDGYNPFARFDEERACENQLLHFATLAPARLDFGAIDGNHDRAYLAREMAALAHCLKPGGYLFLDDVNWPDLRPVFEHSASGGWERVGTDGRVGVLRRCL